ncbi:DNA primase family protein [Jeotgalibaca porci]
MLANSQSIEKIKHDGQLNVSWGKSKTETEWKNKTILWSDFLKILSDPVVTYETVAEYTTMPKSQRDNIKDVGGFVGGFLKQGRRKADHVQSRSIVTLDADSGHKDLWENVKLLSDYSIAVYTTHSHTPSKPRYRFIIPLSRPVTVDEYEPLARMIAFQHGMDYFDDTTYQAERLMFKPSHSKDAEFIFDYVDDPWLDPDTILRQYEDWTDASFWPESSRGHAVRARSAKKQGDPLEKPGIIGAFNRSFSIKEAIAEFLPDVYTESRHPDRYTYIDGSTSGGLVIYEDKFAYSHHGTDPVGDVLVNAFDLVRIHKYGELDENVKPSTNFSNYPSQKAMHEFANSIDRVRALAAQEIFADFGVEETEVVSEHEEPADTDWIEVSNRGSEINTFMLASLLIKEIPTFYDGYEFLRYESSKGIWVNDSDAFLRSYITKYKLGKETKIKLLNETIASIKSLSYSGKPFGETDLNKIVLENGVYDFKKDTFVEEFSADLYSRSSHPIRYNAEAGCPVFKSFLKEVVGEEQVPFIFEWFGYNFYRSYDVQKMLFIHGKGGTGKSTLINVLQSILGPANHSAVTLRDLMTERFSKVALHRKVANFDSDAKPEYLADGSTLKMLTGEDTIFADRKNQEPITFYNYAKLTFSLNSMPAMRDFSGGLKRRMLILTMNKKITEEMIERYPIEAIRGELAGIFNEAMKGLRRLMKNKAFTETDEMKAQVDQWQKGNDVVSLFIEDECEVGPDFNTPVKEAYEDYKNYCQSSGYRHVTRNAFSQRMTDLGYESKVVALKGAGANGKSKSVRCYTGVKTSTDII